MIAPWDLEPGHDLEEWVEAANVLAELSSVRARKKASQKVFESRRRAHKNYASLHYKN